MVGLAAVDELSTEFEVADRPAEVYRTLGELLSAAQDIETGQRGYLLSGNEAYLEPYDRALGEVDPLLDRLDRLVSWNPLQVSRMPTLRGRVDSVRSYYAESVAQRRARGLGPALARVESGDGKRLMDSVRESIQQMEQEAVRVRGVREARVRRAQRSARRALWASTGVLALALVLASLVVRQTLRSRERASAALEAEREALSQALAEREQALLRVQTMQAQLVQQEKLAGLGRLTAGVAHELKNPLNFVTNFAALADEIAEEIADDLAAGDAGRATAALDDLRANTQRVVEHADRADGIVRSMLTHARGISGSREPVDLALALADAAAYALGPAASGVEVVVEAPDEPVVVEGVPLALGRLFQNLVANAAHAVLERAGLGSAPAGHPYTPTITLRTRVERDLGAETAVVEVDDNGAGIPDADVARVFEPFFTTKAPGQGTGLGLPLAHDIAVGHGGSLVAGEAPGGGARFTVRLPLRAPLAAGDGTAVGVSAGA